MLQVHEHPGKRSECEVCLTDPKIQELLSIKRDLEQIVELDSQERINEIFSETYPNHPASIYFKGCE